VSRASSTWRCISGRSWTVMMMSLGKVVSVLLCFDEQVHFY